MTDHTADAWEIAAAYERYVGRWSRPVASKFLQWLPPAGAGAAWCDVGCGTGALAHAVLVAEEPSRVVGVEPSEGFAAAARTTVDDPRFEVRPGTAAAIPAVDGEFDRVVSGLVLNFLPDPIEGLVEMRRVTRAGGTIGGYVWDYAEGMEMIRAFWDAAVELDEAARDRDEGVRFPLCRPDPLHDLLASAGLTGVRIQPLEVPPCSPTSTISGRRSSAVRDPPPDIACRCRHGAEPNCGRYSMPDCAATEPVGSR